MKGCSTCQEDEDVSRSIFFVDVRGCLDGRSDIVRAWMLQIVYLRSIILAIMHWQLRWCSSLRCLHTDGPVGLLFS